MTKHDWDRLNWSDVTPKTAYLSRRGIMTGALALAGVTVGGLPGRAEAAITAAASKWSTEAAPNTLKEISSYNNYYEFGFDKTDPRINSRGFKTSPWSVKIDGMVDKPGDYGLDDLMTGVTLEERIYRLRCVEAWSMVVPWIGFEMAQLLNRVGVQPGAKYVALQTVLRPEEMPGQRSGGIDWPYVEGLRLDEAMHPLTILATGLYGEALPNQNGAPIRLVVPWKYGFKSIKSIVRITLTDSRPPTTWNVLQPREYGFYANVNPKVDHPRWSQATERRIGAGIFSSRNETLPFNGYGDAVAGLYAGMDLAKNY